MDPKITLLLIAAQGLIEDAMLPGHLTLELSRTLADVLERTAIELQGGHAAYCGLEDCPCRMTGREDIRP